MSDLFYITLDELISALDWIKNDERNFDLSHRVEVTDKGVFIHSASFIYSKIKWKLQK